MMGLPLEHAPEPAWQDIWVNVQERVRLECGQGIYDTWIAPLALAEVTEGQVKLSAPGRLVRDYVALHHAARLERAKRQDAADRAKRTIVASAAALAVDMRAGNHRPAWIAAGKASPEIAHRIGRNVKSGLLGPSAAW